LWEMVDVVTVYHSILFTIPLVIYEVTHGNE
jgi:hypothetical protein